MRNHLDSTTCGLPWN